MLMDDTQTRTTAASLFSAPMVPLNKGFVLLVWCSTELWRFATGLNTFVVKVSISRSTRLGPSHLSFEVKFRSFEVKLVQGRDYIKGFLYFLTYENYMPSIYRANLFHCHGLTQIIAFVLLWNCVSLCSNRLSFIINMQSSFFSFF